MKCCSHHMNGLNRTLSSSFPEGPFVDECSVSKIGRSLVIAPHQDDESLACGGTIALLRKNNCPVHVLFLTDGTKSHPHSKSFPPLRLQRLREEEANKALIRLGVAGEAVSFLRFPDSMLNKLSSTANKKAIKLISEAIIQFQPNTIFLPWRNDPHPDHIASWHLVKRALNGLEAKLSKPIRQLEYLLWFWERTKPEEIQSSKSTRIWRVDVSSTIAKKVHAIHEHKSQLGLVIFDDKSGFCLPPSLLKNLQRKEEVFLEYDFVQSI